MKNKISTFLGGYIQQLIESEHLHSFIDTHTKLVIVKEFELEVYPSIEVKSALTSDFAKERYLARFKDIKITVYQKITYKRTFKKPFRFLNFRTCYKRSSFERFTTENAFGLMERYYKKSDKGKKPVKIPYDNKSYNLMFKSIDKKPKSQNRYLN